MGLEKLRKDTLFVLRRFAHSVNHELDIVRIGIGSYPVSKVKDVWPARKGFDDTARLVNERLAPRHHVCGSKIPLYTAIHLHMHSSPFRLN